MLRALEAEAGGSRPADEAPSGCAKEQRPVRSKTTKQGQASVVGQMVVPAVPAVGCPNPVHGSDLQAEAVGDIELDEEVERLIREEALGKTTVPDPCRGSSASKDSSEWLEKGKGKGSKGRTEGKSPQFKAPTSPGGSPKKAVGLPKSKYQIPQENSTDPPLIEISNRFGVLSGEEGDAEEPLGDVGPHSPGAVSRGREAGPVRGNKDAIKSVEMDTSTSRKREREGGRRIPSDCSSSDGEGGGRKKAV